MQSTRARFQTFILHLCDENQPSTDAMQRLLGHRCAFGEEYSVRFVKQHVMHNFEDNTFSKFVEGSSRAAEIPNITDGNMFVMYRGVLSFLANLGRDTLEPKNLDFTLLGDQNHYTSSEDDNLSMISAADALINNSQRLSLFHKKSFRKTPGPSSESLCV